VSAGGKSAGEDLARVNAKLLGVLAHIFYRKTYLDSRKITELCGRNGIFKHAGVEAVCIEILRYRLTLAVAANTAVSTSGADDDCRAASTVGIVNAECQSTFGMITEKIYFIVYHNYTSLCFFDVSILSHERKKFNIFGEYYA
jgi:hypothetical protein